MSFLEPTSEDSAKILVIGKSGVGKTGGLASLVAAGYKLRILDTDKGIRPLRSLLRDPHYPYAAACAKFGVDPNETVDIITIDQKMRILNGEIIPSDARGWSRAAGAIGEWKHDGINFGNIGTWGTDVILVIDTFSTLAKMCYYYIQSLNGRLGKRDEGFDYQRDVGGAQSHLARLLELLYCSAVTCNVIINTHVTWVDDSQGFVQSPEQRARNQERPRPEGYPSAIGRALSPVMGKYFNDVFAVSAIGSGEHVKRVIKTVPNDGIVCKNSTYLQPEYDITTGMAEIISSMRGVPLPDGFIEALRPKKVATVARPLATPLPKPAAVSG